MEIYGYFIDELKISRYEEYTELLKQYGCTKIYNDTFENEEERPEFVKMIDNISANDTLVFISFSNATRGARELNAIFNFCRLNAIRIISVEDKIDSKNEYTKTLMDTLGTLPQDIEILKRRNRDRQSLKKNRMSKEERDKKIIDMYNQNYEVEWIMFSTNVKSNSTIYEVLNKNGIPLRNK